MKTKFRFAGRGGQGIKFVGSTLARVAMAAGYHTTVSVHYTPSVRGGPIFCDVVIGSEPILYPFCDGDADVFLALDQKGFDRAFDGVGRHTVSLVDAHTVVNPEKAVNGEVIRCPFTKCADENKMPATVNLLALGFLSMFIHGSGSDNRFPQFTDDQYRQVLDAMPTRFRDTNSRAFSIGRRLYEELCGEQ